MASILEFTLAEIAAASIDAMGICAHPCAGYSPLGLAKAEADDLQRFDPDSFSKLKEIGVTVHDVEVEDFEFIGNLSHLPMVSAHDARTCKKLYKHAIAVRLERSILISDVSPEKDSVENICMSFGNEYYVL